MSAIRSFWRANRVAAIWLFALALGVKLLIPQGFMLGREAETRYLTVQLCFDGATHRTAQIAIPMESAPGKSGDRDEPDQHCPFTSLGMGAWGAIDAPIAAAAALFILVSGFVPVRPASRGRTPFLRPPLRGPPLS